VVADVRNRSDEFRHQCEDRNHNQQVWTYVVTGIRPGRYRMAVTKEGFRSIVGTDVTLNVSRRREQEFNLDVGAFSESITVTADQINMNTTDASVSTVVDRQFAENIPLNGRSFQSLIQLTPGVVLTR